MATLFMGLTGFFLLATLITLGVGIFSMGRGGEFNQKHGNRLMRLRVIFQGLAVASFVLFLVAR